MSNKIIEIFVYPDGRVDAKNAAIYLGLSEKTLAMKRCEGTGPKFIKMGRIFYFIRDLDAWIEEHRRSASTCPTLPKVGSRHFAEQ